MKRIIAFIVALTAVGAAHAGRTVYESPLVNDADIPYNQNFDIDVASLGVDHLSMQADYSSSTFSNRTFQDGQISTNTLTVSTVSLTTLAGAAATDTLTFSDNTTYAKAQATNTVFISTTNNSGSVLWGHYVSINGVNVTCPNDWGIVATATGTMTSLVNAINNRVPGFTAAISTYSTAGATVTITSNIYGAAANAYTLSSSTPTAIVCGAATFSGGQNAATFTLNSQTLTAGIDWTVADVASNTAVNVKNLINSTFSEVTAATSAATVVTITAAAAGTPGNAYTLASSTGTLAVGGATFSGGQYPAYVTINGTSLIEGTNWTAATTSTGTAKAISDAIMSNVTLSAVVKSTWTSTVIGVSTYGVISATSTAVGAATRYPVTTNKASVLVWGSSTFYGGSDSDIKLGSANIIDTAHGLVTGLPVLYTSGTVTWAPLANQTTYYVRVVDANTFQLSATSTGAVAGSVLVFTSSSTTGPHTFTVAPLSITGTPSFKWQGSNTGSAWFDLVVTSVTFSSPYTAATTGWDLGAYDYRYLRLAVTAPTTGALNLTVTPLGRKEWYLP